MELADAVEPLPSSSALWEMENVIISPHNADQNGQPFWQGTARTLLANARKLVAGEELECVIDMAKGY